MAAGDVVVTAFRLQQSAPVSGIVVGEATYRASQRSIGYREIGAHRGEGKEEPVRAWEAVAVEDSDRPATPLVGRDSELSYLSSLAFAEAEQGCCSSRCSEPRGSERRACSAELRELVTGDTSGIIWRQGRCLSYGTGVSFSAFGELVKQHAGILESDPAEIVERKVSAAVGALVDDTTTRHWIEAYLRPLVGLEGAERLSGDRRGEAFSAWRLFIEALAANGRVVLAFEDLHWADDGLLDFLEHLHLWAGDIPVTIVSTARPELGERRPGWSSLLELEPLSSDETGELVEALLGTTRLRSERREELLARAAGNPLYAEEFVRMLQERTDDEELPLPETVQALIAGRLDTLHPEAKEVLRDAAVIGTGFWVGALAHVGGLHPEAGRAKARGSSGRNWCGRGRGAGSRTRPVRVLARSHPRRRLRADPTRRACREAPGSRCVDRVAGSGPRGPRAARAPLHAGARVCAALPSGDRRPQGTGPDGASGRG
jgi:hypothetical protein